MYLMTEHKPLPQAFTEQIQFQAQRMISNHQNINDHFTEPSNKIEKRNENRNQKRNENREHDIKTNNNIFELSSLFHLVKMYTKNIN